MDAPRSRVPKLVFGLLVAAAAVLGLIFAGATREPYKPPARTTLPTLRARGFLQPGNTPATPATPAAPAPPAAAAPSQTSAPLSVDPQKFRQVFETAAREVERQPPAAVSAPATAPGEGPRGTLGKEEIQAAVRSVLPAVKECFETGMKMKEDSQGKVVVDFTLAASDGGGAITRAEIVNSELGNPVVDACVINALTTAHFPMPRDGEVRVTYPFRFAKQEP